MKKSFSILVVMTLISAQIFSQSIPVADFSSDDSTGCAPQVVQFTNLSTGAISWTWDFGNGATSVAENPVIVFTSPGTYTVKLIAFNSGGQSDTLIKYSFISVYSKPSASFTVSSDTVCSLSDTVQFINTSSGAATWLWDFGDGVLSSDTNPVHIYSAGGVYSLAMIAAGATGCTDVKVLNQYLTVSPSPIADFSVSPAKACSLNIPLSFSSLYQAGVSWYWNFGDGLSSSLQNPQHAYTTVGKYTVSLLVTSAQGCKKELIKPGFISVSAAIAPVVFVSDSAGCSPLPVLFSTTTQAASYQWNFGNSNYSTFQNPTYIYNDTGVFSVSLSVTDSNGCTYISTKNHLVSTLDPVKADFTESSFIGCAPFEVSFTNTTVKAFSWLWDFGDGTTSGLKHPVHIYSQPGKYSVTLTAAMAGCTSVVKKINVIEVNSPYAAFSTNDSVGCSPFNVQFSDMSINAITWEWDFGNGTVSSLSNPALTLDTPRYYTVKLIVKDSAGCSDTLVKPDILHVFTPVSGYVPPDTVTSCGPVTTSFNGSSAGTAYWHWNFGDSTTSNLSNPTHTFQKGGTWSVALITKDANGCSVTIPGYSVFKIELEDVDFTAVISQCPDSTVSFTSLSTGAVAWLWNFGDGSSSTQQHPQHIYTVSGSYTVSLAVTSASGCTNSVTKINAVNFVKCKGAGGSSQTGLPPGVALDDSTTVISFGDSSASNPVIKGCAPLQIGFVNIFNNSVSQHWIFGDGSSSFQKNPIHYYNSPGIYTIRLYVQDSTGEKDSAVWYNYIGVYNIHAIFATDQTNSCFTSTVTLTDSSVNAAGWKWNFGDGDTSSFPQVTHAYTQSGNYAIRLTVTDTNGCSDVAVQNILTGVINPVFSYGDKVCVNDTVSFSCSLYGFYAYQWNFGDSTSATGFHPPHSYSNGGTYYPSLTVFDSAGCFFTIPLPKPVIVFEPLASFALLSPASGCDSLNVIFNNTSVGADSWLWHFGNGDTTLLQNANYTYTQPGTYIVKLSAFKNNCASVVQQQVITVNAVNVDFSFMQNGDCMPVTATFTGLSNTAASWLWNFGDGTTSSQQNPVHQFTSAPSGNITLEVTDSNGCKAIKSVSPLSVFTVNFSVSATKGCDSLTVAFSDTSHGAVSWNWDFGDGTISTLKSPVHTYSDTGKWSVTLIAGSSSGCYDSVKYDSFIIVEKVVASFTTMSVLSGCNPLVISYSNQSYNASFYEWNLGDGQSSQQVQPWHIYTIPGNYDVSLVASNSNGCRDTIVKQSYIGVTGPYSKFSITDTSGCVPVSLTITDSSLNSNGSYTWYFGDGDTSNSKQPFHTYNNIGNYTVSLFVEDTTGCTSFYTFPHTVNVHTLPKAEISVKDTAGCQPLEIIFNNFSSGAESYRWEFGDSSASVNANPVYIFNDSGKFQPMLIAFSEFGCTDTVFAPEITVHSTPVAEFQADKRIGCSPTTVNFTNTSSRLSQPVYHWSFGNGSTSSSQNTSSVYNNGGFYDVTLHVVNGSGCADTHIKPAFIEVTGNTPPVPSQILTATVISNTSAYILWDKSTAGDFAAYILYRMNSSSGVYEQIATQTDAGILSYTDENLNTLNNSYCYKLQTMDTCGNGLLIKDLTEYCTINISARPKDNFIRVSWTPYKGCDADIYEVYRKKKDSDSFVLSASVNKNTLFFNDSLWDCNTQYIYQVKAVKLCGNAIFSVSDTAISKANEAVLQNQQALVVRTTVIENSEILTEWKAPEFAPEKLSGYIVMRSTDGMNFSRLIALDSKAHSYIDTDVNVSSNRYVYRIDPLNECNVEAKISNPGTSLLLKAETGNFNVELNWSEYRGWAGGVDEYIIEKQKDDGTWEVIKIVDGKTTKFSDSLTDK